MESIGDLRRRIGLPQSTAGEIQHEHVHRAAREQAARDAEPLAQTGRRDDDEPFESDAAGDGLDRVETARQVQPGHDRARRLRLRRDPQRERRPPAGAVAPDRDTGTARETTRTQDRIERGEPRVDDPVVGERRDRWPGVRCLVRLRRLGCQRERPHDPRSCGTPASLEARDGGVHIGARGRHRTPIVEHLF